MTGGFTDASSYDSSSVIYENGAWRYGVNLPEEGLEEHCMVQLDDNTIILSGGETGPSFSNLVHFFDIPSETWSEAIEMPETRFRHGCGVATRFVPKHVQFLLRARACVCVCVCLCVEIHSML